MTKMFECHQLAQSAALKTDWKDIQTDKEKER